MSICSIPGCGKGGQIRRGWCSAHYFRWRSHGDPLAGRTPNGEPERYYLEEVITYEGDDCLLWPYARNNYGYGHMWFEGRDSVISRLVCEEANGPPPSPKHEAAHSCGQGSAGCVTKGHVRWAIHIDNEADKRLHGTTNRGENNGCAKLSQDDVETIRALEGKQTQQAIADAYGLQQAHVSNIQRGKRWAWLYDDRFGPNADQLDLLDDRRRA